MQIRISSGLLIVAALLVLTGGAFAQDDPAPTGPRPAPPSNLIAEDTPWDGGEKIDLRWDLSPDDEMLSAYKIYRSLSDPEVEVQDRELSQAAVDAAKLEATEQIVGEDWQDQYGDISLIPYELRIEARKAREAAAAAAMEQAEGEADAKGDVMRWIFVDVVPAGETEYTVQKLLPGEEYLFRVAAVSEDAVESAPVATTAVVSPGIQFFDGTRFFLLVITIIFGGAVIVFILLARSGKPLKVRKIAGLEAIDEAVGRATEMGRSVLFVPGIQDMNDIQTIAGITVLARVAKTAAEYDAKVEVPTARSLVMTTARETVQSAFLGAGRPDAYNEDLIYYVTDEQFGYVAYLSGMMVREKPAACIYMGSFYAESLILAETGNSIGAIQVAGTAQPAQLPFFVAACDYTLIGEEFFAASAYLSGSAEELGSLKGQDVGKIVVAVVLLVGVFIATVASATDSAVWYDALEYLKGTILS